MAGGSWGEEAALGGSAENTEGAGWESRGWGCGLPQRGMSLEGSDSPRSPQEDRSGRPEAKIRKMEEGPQPQWEEGRHQQQQMKETQEEEAAQAEAEWQQQELQAYAEHVEDAVSCMQGEQNARRVVETFWPGRRWYARAA